MAQPQRFPWLAQVVDDVRVFAEHGARAWRRSGKPSLAAVEKLECVTLRIEAGAPRIDAVCDAFLEACGAVEGNHGAAALDLLGLSDSTSGLRKTGRENAAAHRLYVDPRTYRRSKSREEKAGHSYRGQQYDGRDFDSHLDITIHLVADAMLASEPGHDDEAHRAGAVVGDAVAPQTESERDVRDITHSFRPSHPVDDRRALTPAHLNLSELQNERSKGFFARKSTADYIADLAGVETMTIYTGAGISADLGAPMRDGLSVSLLQEWVFNRGDLRQQLISDRATSDAIVAALSSEYSPPYLGSIARELARSDPQDDDPDRQADFTTFIRGALGERRVTGGGFLARAVGALAFAFRRAGKRITVVTTNYDSALLREQDHVRVWLEDVDDRYHFKSATTFDDGDAKASGTNIAPVPLLHVNGSLSDTTHPWFVVGEADYFARYGRELRHVEPQHQWRSGVLAQALGDTVCLFVGSSLTDPDVLAALAATKHGKPRYALLLLPDLNDANGNPLCHDTNTKALLQVLVASRFLHLGVIPIIADYPHQIPQFLREVALKALADRRRSAYRAYGDRFAAWWTFWAPVFGFELVRGVYEPTERDVKVQSDWRDCLRGIRDTLVKELDIAESRGDSEQLLVEVWLKHPDRMIFLWATSEAMWLHSGSVHSGPLSEDQYLAAATFRRGQSWFQRLDSRRKWRSCLSMPITLHEYQLPIGVVNVWSNKLLPDRSRDIDGKQTERETAENESKLAVAMKDEAKLRKIEKIVKTTINNELDPLASNPKPMCLRGTELRNRKLTFATSVKS